MSKITYRPLSEADIDKLADAALEDWTETYDGFIALEEIEEFVNEAYHPDRIEAMIPEVKAGKMGFWVAESDNSIQGWLQLADFGSGMEIGRNGFRLEETVKELMLLADAFVKEKGKKKYFSYVDQDDEVYKIRLESNGFTHLAKKDDGSDRYLEKSI